MNSPYKVKHVYPWEDITVAVDAWGNTIKTVKAWDLLENKYTENIPNNE